ncbi:MAG TPA: aminodeoxychorismate lyase, partial [Rikenellaceae bacterium]|nr:aminodeoxychorismate lyase [Rikenellaceae bacterium]
DSPYNTYRHKGLPPGPICVPSKAALDAVLNPDFGGKWGLGNMFFCASPKFDGTHVFARTLPEHN